MFKLLSKVNSGKHVNSPDLLTMRRVVDWEILTDKHEPVNVDGEVDQTGPLTPLKGHVRHHAFQMFRPAAGSASE